MRYQHIFFDLDDTLYPSQVGLWEAIRARMNRYLVDVLRFPEAEAAEVRRRYFEEYGTTLSGLQAHHQVDADDYLAYVHDLPLTQYLKPLPAVRQVIQSLPQQCWIFTNADAAHARRVLSILELEGLFQQVIDVRAVGWAPKPRGEAYQRALCLAGSPEPYHCVLLDDSVRNLAPARAMGFTTVLVRANGEPDPVADLTIACIQELPDALPQLWDVE